MSKQFWKFVTNEAKESELILEGVIASESWFDDEVSPKQFREQLDEHKGDITVRINSPGGDVFAGVQIYNMLKDRQDKVTVVVDALAASAASFIAMAGDRIIMNSGSMMMVHKASTMAWGNEDDMKEVAEMLRKIDDSIIGLYADRTGKSKEEIKALLAAETWMTAEEAVEMGFADEAVEGKTKLTDMVKNVIALTKDVNNAVMQPAMSMKAKLEVKNEQEVEETDVTDTAETTEEVTDEVSTTTDETETVEAETKPEEGVVGVTETTEETEEVVAETNNSVDKEIEMSKQEEVAKTQVIEPKAQATVDAKPTAKSYLESPKALEDFAIVMAQNAGRKPSDVKDAWGKHLSVEMGITNPEVLLPPAVIQAIEDAFKEGGEIWNAVSKTGLDVFSVAYDSVSGEDSRAKGYNRDEEDEKAEEVITLVQRTLRPQFIYKYLTLPREVVKEQRDPGALLRYVLTELPRRIVREVERAIVIGDGRTPGSAYAIDSFLSVKSDAAGGVWATTVAGTGDAYVDLLTASAAVKADGSKLLVAKSEYLIDVLTQQGVNGGFLFAPGTNVANIFGFSGVVTPDWMDDDTDNDAYIFTPSNYRTVGDSTIESFTNFALKTNTNEYLQEIWAGGGLAALKAGVAISNGASS